MAKKKTKTQKLLQSAFHEVKHNQPKVVMHTAAAKGPAVAAKQRIAIALSKARDKGARIPRRKM